MKIKGSRATPARLRAGSPLLSALLLLILQVFVASAQEAWAVISPREGEFLSTRASHNVQWTAPPGKETFTVRITAHPIGDRSNDNTGEKVWERDEIRASVLNWYPKMTLGDMNIDERDSSLYEWFIEVSDENNGRARSGVFFVVPSGHSIVPAGMGVFGDILAVLMMVAVALFAFCFLLNRGKYILGWKKENDRVQAPQANSSDEEDVPIVADSYPIAEGSCIVQLPTPKMQCARSAEVHLRKSKLSLDVSPTRLEYQQSPRMWQHTPTVDKEQNGMADLHHRRTSQLFSEAEEAVALTPSGGQWTLARVYTPAVLQMAAFFAEARRGEGGASEGTSSGSVDRRDSLLRHDVP